MDTFKVPEICVISEYFTKSYEMSPKQTPKNAFNNASLPKSSVETIEDKVVANLDSVQLKINGMSVGILELMNSFRYGENWEKKDMKELYSYLNGAPLNGVYLEQFLKKEGYDVFSLENFSSEKDLLKKIIENGCQFVVISTSHFTQEFQITDISSFVKDINKDCKIIAGGAFIRQIAEPDNLLWSMKANEAFKRLYGLIDIFIVEKHGELSLLKVLDYYRNNGSGLNEIGNLIYFDGKGDLVRTRIDEEYRPLNDITYDYGQVRDIDRKRYLCVLTSRGCPFKCKFCTYHHIFKALELKSIDILEKELDSIPIDGRPRHVRFADDNFAVNKKRLYEFCKMLVEKKYGFSWSCMSSPHSLSEENVKIMKDSGCKIVFMGIESANDDVLKNMDKGSRVKDYYKAIELLKKAGIETIGSFIIGFPGETDQTIEDNIRLINDSGMDYYQANLWLLFPNMPIFRERRDYGLRGLIYGWQHGTMNAYEASHAMIHILESVKTALTNTFGLTNSVQATIEYLYSLGFLAGEIRSFFECYTKIVKNRVSLVKYGKNIHNEQELLEDFKNKYNESIQRIG
jgi:anaerobic magnesium-protoporphyrin IX monomethyl ester cyclase